LGESAVSLDPRLFNLANLHVEFLQRLLHRLDQLVDCGLALFKIAARPLLKFFQRGVGEI